MTDSFLAECFYDPVLFCEDQRGLRQKLHPRERRVLLQMSARMVDGEKHLRMHLRTCHGWGKTFLCAVIFLWWMLTRYLAKGITTAPGQRSVDRLLWSQIRRIYANSAFAGRIGKMMDSSEFRVDYNDDWLGFGVSSDEPIRLEGNHSPTSALLIFDEAKGVPDETRDSLQGFLDAPETLLIAISTPWIESGWYWEMDVRGGADIMRVVGTIDDVIADGQESAIHAKKDYLERFGSETDPRYQSRVLARYISSNPFSPILVDSLDYCMDREPDFEGQKVSALDVGSGEMDETDRDHSWIAHAQGTDVISLVHCPGRDIVQTAHTLSYEAKEWGASLLRPDANGIGAGPTWVLVEDGWTEEQIDPFVAQSRPNDTDSFVDRASEAAKEFADRINQKKCSLPKDNELRRQCLQIQLVPRAGGKLKLEKRPKVNGIKQRSPDRFDACIMAVASPKLGDSDGLMGYLRSTYAEDEAKKKEQNGQEEAA